MTTCLRLLGLASVAVLGVTPGLAQSVTAKEGGTGADKVICKRETPIGSLIASRKVCLTKSQWADRATRGNEEARRQMEENAARNATPSN